MKNKLVYDNKRVYKKTLISKEEHDKILDEAAVAEMFLNDERFAFLREILLSAQRYAQESIVENTIMKVSEEHNISNTIKKIFTQPKRVQVDELSGQYKLVKKFFEEVREYIDLKDNLQDQISNDKVSVNE